MSEGNQSIRPQKDPICKTIVHNIATPFIGSTLAIAYATGRWDLSVFVTGLAITGSLALFARLERVFIQPRLEQISRDWLRLETELFISLAGHILGTLLALLICGRIFGFQVEPVTSWMLLLGIVLVFPILHGAEMALGYYRQLVEKERVEQELRALAAQAELKALKAQINPHFLFNSLNTIAALIHTNPALAEATVERLATMFRYALAGSERGEVRLEEELAFVDDYLAIEQARFGEQLRVTQEIAPEVLDVPVPGLIFQPVVENAVKHGHGEDNRVDLTIRAKLDGDAVLIAIADQGPGMPAGYRIGDGLGHGLRNVDERLKKMYGNGLEILANKPQGAVVRIRIPL